MRINGLISYAIMLAFLMADSQAVLQPDSVSLGPGQSLADALLEQSGSPSTYYASRSGNFTTPQEEREKRLKQEGINWNMPSSLSNSGSTPSESRNLVNNQSSVESLNATSSPQTLNTSNDAQLESSDSITQNASGSWLFELNDSIQRKALLALFQDGNSIFGKGSIRENNSTYQLMASGMLQGDAMNLDLTSQDPMRLYKLLLNLSGDGASGKYSVISASGDKWNGDAEGLRLAP
jgi:hypothetical protein